MDIVSLPDYPLTHRSIERHKERTLKNLHASDVQLSKADLDKITKIMEKSPIHGARNFGDRHHGNQKLWG